MNHEEWLEKQFNARVIEEGERKGWICFRTPLFNYAIKRSDWECIKKKIMKV